MPAWVRGTAALLLLLLWSPAHADTAAAAALHTGRAEGYYRVSNYPAALSEYREAYHLQPRPDLLFNIARCLEVMARLDLAISHYQRYLEARPDASDRKLVEERLANLKRRRAEDRAAPRGSRTPAGDRSSSLAGWVTLGVGAGALITGVVFSALASSKADEFTAGVRAGRTFTVLDEIDRTGRTYQGVQIGMLIAGGVLTAAAGGYLLWCWTRDRRRAGEQRAIWSVPVISGAGVGIVTGARF